MALDPSSGLAAADAVADADAALPIFEIQPVQLVAADFVAGQAANNVLVIALLSGRILRIDLNKPEDIDGKTTTHHRPPPTAPSSVPSLLSLSPTLTTHLTYASFPWNRHRPP